MLLPRVALAFFGVGFGLRSGCSATAVFDCDLHTLVSRQSPTANPPATAKATMLTHMGMSEPLTVTLQSINTRNACTKTT
jgi:hypothetical protein